MYRIGVCMCVSSVPLTRLKLIACCRPISLYRVFESRPCPGLSSAECRLSRRRSTRRRSLTRSSHPILPAPCAPDLLRSPPPASDWSRCLRQSPRCAPSSSRDRIATRACSRMLRRVRRIWRGIRSYRHASSRTAHPPHAAPRFVERAAVPLLLLLLPRLSRSPLFRLALDLLHRSARSLPARESYFKAGAGFFIAARALDLCNSRPAESERENALSVIACAASRRSRFASTPASPDRPPSHIDAPPPPRLPAARASLPH
ncbi:hypothetical protein FB451DRAFT_44612 [Mycena latifolia]|nr:hypothetical protein FB451DRAFT_44612 [Mycena latifolia]